MNCVNLEENREVRFSAMVLAICRTLDHWVGDKEEDEPPQHVLVAWDLIDFLTLTRIRCVHY